MHKSKPIDDASPPETVSDRLRLLIAQVGMKQVHLANKLGVTPQAIHQLCTGKQHFSKHTQKIAQLLNANEDWLKTGKGSPFLTKQTTHLATKIVEFPVYRLSQLNTLKNNLARMGSLIPQEKYVTTRQYQPDSFGFYIEDLLFAPKFEMGDIILIEPIALEKIMTGNIVLFYHGESHQVVFCYIQKTKEGRLMGWQPSISAPSLIEISQHDLIFGCYRECLKND